MFKREFYKRKKKNLLFDLLKGTHGFNLFSDTLNVLNGGNGLIPHTEGQTILFPDSSDDNSDIKHILCNI